MPSSTTTTSPNDHQGKKHQGGPPTPRKDTAKEDHQHLPDQEAHHQAQPAAEREATTGGSLQWYSSA